MSASGDAVVFGAEFGGSGSFGINGVQTSWGHHGVSANNRYCICGVMDIMGVMAFSQSGLERLFWKVHRPRVNFIVPVYHEKAAQRLLPSGEDTEDW